MKEKWQPGSIYLYLVCLITLVMSIVGTIQFVQGGVELLIGEEPYYPSPLEIEGRYVEGARPSPEVIEKQVIIERERSIKGEQRRRAINVIRSLSFMVVAFPIYLYHWKLIKRENSLRENSANPQGPGTPV